MKPGSVIVDLAAAGGGNCTLTKAGEVVLTDNGVRIVGYTDLPARMAMQASAMCNLIPDRESQNVWEQSRQDPPHK